MRGGEGVGPVGVDDDQRVSVGQVPAASAGRRAAPGSAERPTSSPARRAAAAAALPRWRRSRGWDRRDAARRWTTGPGRRSREAGPTQVNATTASTKIPEAVTARLPTTSTRVAGAGGSRRPRVGAVAANSSDTARVTTTAMLIGRRPGRRPARCAAADRPAGVRRRRTGCRRSGTARRPGRHGRRAGAASAGR